MTLDASGITVKFGGVTALSDVNVSVEPGTIVGLVGPNGAGKTTLFNCLTGVVTPQVGGIYLDGQDISKLRLDYRIRLGIARTFQTPRFDPAGTVLDAVLLGYYPQLHQSVAEAFLPLRKKRLREAELSQKARALIAAFELTDDPLTMTGELSLGRLRLLEVARALASNPKYLLLDEPAAGTSEHDRHLLATAIRKAASDGLGVLLVEHSVSFVAELSHKMVALIQGKVVVAGKPTKVVADERVISAYLGANRVAA